MKTSRVILMAGVLFHSAIGTAPAETRSAESKTSRLRLFNTDIFGISSANAVVLLRPSQKGQIDPETVMVDINKGKYFAATVSYPKTISLEEARKSLNTKYAPHEKKSFANDPTMGLWRNEADQFSIQLSEDEDHIVVIYIKFSMVTDEIVFKAISRAMRESAKENDSD